MKKFITLLIFVALIIGIIASTTACATDISAIMPNNNTIIITDPPELVINKPIPISPNNSTIIIVPLYDTPAPEESVVIIENNKPTTVNNNNNNNNTNSNNTFTIPSGLIEDIFVLVNQARMDRQLEPLMYNAKLQEVADLRAKEISQKFSHTRPDGTPCYTAFPQDYNCAGENIIMADWQIATADILMDTWMNSQGHRDNILAARYTSIAIGVYRTETLTYVTQLFIG